MVKGVSFFVGDKELGSALRDGDTFTLAWDTSRVELGDYRLRAVPYGGPGVTQLVTVARRGSGGTVATPGAPSEDGGSEDLDLGDDPLNLGSLIGL